MQQPCRDALVFDVGGTSLRAGVYSLEARALVAELTEPTPNAWTFPGDSCDQLRERLFAQMKAMGRALLGDRPPAVVSAALPGPVRPDGWILGCPTVFGDRDAGPFALQGALEQVFPGARVLILNDVTAAGYRYVHEVGPDFCILTVSSGIGHKVFVEGRAAVGPLGKGGEVGHWRADWSPDAATCDCGGQGHLATVASGRGVLARAQRQVRLGGPEVRASCLWPAVREDAQALDNPRLVAAFRDGDPWVVSLIRDAAAHVARALAFIHVAVGTERFVIIGGFAMALGERYRRELAAAAAQSAWDQGLDWDQAITLARLEDAAGLTGAGRYAELALGAAR